MNRLGLEAFAVIQVRGHGDLDQSGRDRSVQIRSPEAVRLADENTVDP